MHWTKLLSGKRFGMEDYSDEHKHDRSGFQRDYDRLIFSSSFRRLQNKTQVFPLPGSVFVHNRLTHSLEVSCVGRSLGNLIAAELQKKYPQEAHLGDIGAIVAAACLAHDMGNPPFGHSGERAITAYFKDGEGQRFEKAVTDEGGRWEDFLGFEGNANTLRLLTHQFAGRRKGGFALTYSTLAAVIKYPYASIFAGDKKKFGFFLSEEDTFLRIADELGMACNASAEGQFLRHPLVYAVEAADDICYQIMDIEDACKLHILTNGEAVELMLAFFEGKRKERVLEVMRMVSDANERIAYLRSSIIGLLVDECARVFLENEEGILNGQFHEPLIKCVTPPPKAAYKACSEVAWQRIYASKEVVDVELAGHRIFSQLISILTDAVMNREQAYSQLLLQRIPEQYDTRVESTYGKLQAVLDYISGMTDVYALDLYRKITGMGLPAV